MPTFIGFNTINQNKYFTAVDFDLIKIDLLNAFNIRQGQLPGRPGYGTTLWDNLFENQTQETLQTIYNEIQRVVGGDPRLFLKDLQILVPMHSCWACFLINNNVWPATFNYVVYFTHK